MKFTVAAPALKSAISRCVKASDKGLRGIPIMQCLRIEAGPDSIVIRATNMRTHIAITVPAEVSIQGVACAPATELSQLAGLAGAKVAFEASGVGLRASWGRSSVTLQTQPAEDFPLPNAVEELQPIDGALLIDAIARCAPAASREETRFYLCGVKIADHESGAVVYGTDGHRMHRVETPGTRFGGSAIIGNADIPILCDMEGPMSFHLSENKWGARAGDAEVWGATIDATYPDVERVRPRDPILIATADVSELIGAVKVAVLGSEDKARSVGVIVRDGEIEVRGAPVALDKMASAGRSTITAETKFDGAAGLNAKYLEASLASIGSETVAIMHSDMSGDTWFSFEPAEQRTDLRMIAIVMPMRVPAEALAA